VLRVNGGVVGISFCTVHLDKPWCFGNYFGVLKGWRKLGASEDFWIATRNKILTISSILKGILFEVDPIDWDLLHRAADRLAYVCGVST
jgi:hypothetical protein